MNQPNISFALPCCCAYYAHYGFLIGQNVHNGVVEGFHTP